MSSDSISKAHITMKLPFNACDNEARLLLSTAYLFRISVLHLHKLVMEEKPDIASHIALKKRYRKKLKEILPNRRDIDGAIALMYSNYEQKH